MERRSPGTCGPDGSWTSLCVLVYSRTDPGTPRGRLTAEDTSVTSNCRPRSAHVPGDLSFHHGGPTCLISETRAARSLRHSSCVSGSEVVAPRGPATVVGPFEKEPRGGRGRGRARGRARRRARARALLESSVRSKDLRRLRAHVTRGFVHEHEHEHDDEHDHDHDHDHLAVLFKRTHYPATSSIVLTGDASSDASAWTTDADADALCARRGARARRRRRSTAIDTNDAGPEAEDIRDVTPTCGLFGARCPTRPSAASEPAGGALRVPAGRRHVCNPLDCCLAVRSDSAAWARPARNERASGTSERASERAADATRGAPPEAGTLAERRARALRPRAGAPPRAPRRPPARSAPARRTAAAPRRPLPRALPPPRATTGRVRPCC